MKYNFSPKLKYNLGDLAIEQLSVQLIIALKFSHLCAMDGMSLLWVIYDIFNPDKILNIARRKSI